MKPLLSICIPTYNRCESVKICVNRWLSFDIPWIEVVVVDNASSDKTKNYMENVRDIRFHYHRNDSNIGFLNIYYCTTHALGEFCMLVSDEDVPKAIDWDLLRKEMDLPFVSMLRGKSVNDYYEVNNCQLLGCNSVDAYKLAFSCAYMSGLIFRRSVFLDIPIKDVEKYAVWRLYPQIVMAFYCVNRGAFFDGVSVELIHTENRYHDESAHLDNITKKPYYDLSSRWIQHENWISLANSIKDRTVRENIIYYLDKKAMESVFGFINSIKVKKSERLNSCKKFNKIDLMIIALKNYCNIISYSKRIVEKPCSKREYALYRIDMITSLRNNIRAAW